MTLDDQMRLRVDVATKIWNSQRKVNLTSLDRMDIIHASIREANFIIKEMEKEVYGGRVWTRKRR